MSEWIKADDKPARGGRYLVKTKCESGLHKALAWNYAYPCCRVNIAYFGPFKGWEYATNIPIEHGVTVTHWRDIPE